MAARGGGNISSVIGQDGPPDPFTTLQRWRGKRRAGCWRSA